MNSPASQPGLPTWLFVVTDLALIVAAAAIAVLSPAPLSTPAMLLVVGCVGLGAFIGLVPLVARYERLKNETLDQRQRALESLSQTVHETAQQISIATGSLHEIADLAQKNLRHAEHLPHKLQEKIAEFQAQLADANDAEKAELEQELTALRTSESERLESISNKIARAAADWAKLEAATAQHLTTLQDTLGRFPAQAHAEFGQWRDEVAQAAGTAREAALNHLRQAETDSLHRLAEAHGRSLANLQAQAAAFEERILAAASTAGDRAAADFRTHSAATLLALDARIAQLTALAASLQSPAVSPAQPAPAAPPPAPDSLPAAVAAPPAIATASASEPATEPAAPASAPAATTVASPPAPKRQRRTRKEDSVTTAPPIPAPVPDIPADPAPATPPPEAEAIPGEATPPAPPPDDLTLPPFAVAKPVAPPPPSVSVPPPELPPAATIAPADPSPPSADPAGEPAPAPLRKRAARKPEPAPEPALDLEFDDSTPAPGSGHVEQTLSSDGATRLIATAYIGIGNRLFIRGEGPGLSWERGVPLQFVSIGKWRWETNDATAPIRFKLYKNDEHECTALGEKFLAPGHLHELVASF